jgi:hypothetical protein
LSALLLPGREAGDAFLRPVSGAILTLALRDVFFAGTWVARAGGVERADAHWPPASLTTITAEHAKSEEELALRTLRSLRLVLSFTSP